jgi:ribosomal protein L11 methyltransferase
MNYVAYHFRVDPPEPGTEILIAMLGEYGFDYFETSEKGFTAYISSECEKQADLSPLSFTDFRFTFSREEIEKKNWNQEWESNFEPITIGGNICIRAPFHDRDPAVTHDLIIMPKMSFGTGHHATTRLMCQAITELDMKSKRVLDMGTGTGVLAILAEKCGSSDILAVDTDSWSVQNAAENFARNDCTNIRLVQGSTEVIRNEPSFDIILANINRNILKAQFPDYADKLKPGGKLLISGFFENDVSELISSLPTAIVYESSGTEGDWAMLWLRKNK